MSQTPVNDALSTVPAAATMPPTQQLSAHTNGGGAFDPAQRAYTSATEDLQNVLEPQERLPAVRPNRNFRHFKNPPQPHMCIRDSTRTGDDLYINVMSWTRIVMPVSAEEPIPLYGGMRVPAGIRGSAAQVYAVMANPEILKHVGRNCEDVEEKHALVELMSDFVEAMNPGLTLTRRAEILKDRDLSGELKDIWSAVQAKRERDKDGFPQSFGTAVQPLQSPSSRTLIVEFGPASAPKPKTFSASTDKTAKTEDISSPNQEKSQPVTINCLAATNETSTCTTVPTKMLHAVKKPPNGDATVGCPIAVSVDETIVVTATAKTSNSVTPESVTSAHVIEPDRNYLPQSTTIDICDTTTRTDGDLTAISLGTSVPKSPVMTTPPSPTTSTPPTSTKKEKIGGFLPNGCHNIFPFIKSKSSNSKKEKKQKANSGGVLTPLPIVSKVPVVEPTKTVGSGVDLSNGTALFDHHSPLMMTTAGTTKMELANINPDYIDLVKNMQLPADACVDKMKKLKL